ncbi:hypothetical protein BKA62DRAFT_780012 [Auriculariales sp. MPI-PUGE-AT-0066]|nr:hypothetical protein BKA62DRAFT_780012 [Auriculariales sp. MPI-PUGE-AT-0066]
MENGKKSLRVLRARSARLQQGHLLQRGLEQPVPREISGQLSGKSLTLQSINARISGNYKASRKISLHTSNAAIDAQLVLGSSSITVPTLKIGTTNGAISGAVRLIDAHSFDGVLHTTDAGIDFALATLPLNGKVTLDAQASNA